MEGAARRGVGGLRTRLALLDEPSYSQDLSGIAQVAEMIKQDAHRRVTLMATHDSLLIDALTAPVAGSQVAVEDVEASFL